MDLSIAAFLCGHISGASVKTQRNEHNGKGNCSKIPHVIWQKCQTYINKAEQWSQDETSQHRHRGCKTLPKYSISSCDLMWLSDRFVLSLLCNVSPEAQKQINIKLTCVGEAASGWTLWKTKAQEPPLNLQVNMKTSENSVVTSSTERKRVGANRNRRVWGQLYFETTLGHRDAWTDLAHQVKVVLRVK